jgi:hypothetical protein
VRALLSHVRCALLGLVPLRRAAARLYIRLGGLCGGGVLMSAVRRGALPQAGAGEVVLVDLPWGKPLKRGRRKVVPVITKAVSADRSALEAWCRRHGVPVGWVHRFTSGWWHVDFWGRGREAVLARVGGGAAGRGGPG